MLTTTFALPVLAVALAAKAAPTKQLDEYPPYYPDYPAVETNPTLEERYLYCPKPRYRCHEACLDYRSVCCIDVHNRAFGCPLGSYCNPPTDPFARCIYYREA